MKDVSPEEFLPTNKELDKLEKDFIVLAARVIVKQIPSMQEVFKDAVVHHIKHQYSEEMETKSEQVINIITMILFGWGYHKTSII